MEVFVPHIDEERIHGRFTPHEDIQRVNQFYERFVLLKIFYYIHSFYLYSRTTKAYF
jgi:hypothetical protein